MKMQLRGKAESSWLASTYVRGEGYAVFYGGLQPYFGFGSVSLFSGRGVDLCAQTYEDLHVQLKGDMYSVL